jgi:hypothetical protein
MTRFLSHDDIGILHNSENKALRSELFVKISEEKELSPEHKDANTHSEVTCLNCP